MRHSVNHAEGSGPGGAAVIAKLPPTQTGWLSGVRDPDVGKALTLLHKQPAHPWMITSLINEVGLSRLVLAKRFRHYLSGTPMGYLARWRLQLATQVLSSTSQSVAEVAREVGDESEPSFNRTFKREFGVPPVRFHTQTRHAQHKPDRGWVLYQRLQKCCGIVEQL